MRDDDAQLRISYRHETTLILVDGPENGFLLFISDLCPPIPKIIHRIALFIRNIINLVPQF